MKFYSGVDVQQAEVYFVKTPNLSALAIQSVRAFDVPFIQITSTKLTTATITIFLPKFG